MTNSSRHDECEETPRTRVGNRSSGYAASAIADAQPSIAGEGTTMRPVNSQRCDDRLNSGPYDLIAVVEFPDDATLTAFLLAVVSQGNIRTTTLRAFNRDEVAEILQRTP
jgi:GYD domain